MLRGLRNNENETIKKEGDDNDFKIKTKFEIDEDPPSPYPFDTIADDFNTELENTDEKSKKTDIIEPKLESVSEIEISDEITKADQEWFDNFLKGIVTTKTQLKRQSNCRNFV